MIHSSHPACWTAEEVYFDDDTSADGSQRKRPAYQRILADIADGQQDAVIAWRLDRLHRLPIELEQFLEICGRANVKDLKT